MTITLTVTKRIATISATERIVAGNTYPIALALDSEWTGNLFMRVRFGSQYYDIPFASSDTSVNVQFPVGYPEVGIGVFSEALEICSNETRVRLLRSILEQGVSVVEFDGDLYDQWAGEVSELLCDDAFDAESTRPVQNAVITAWKDTVPLDSALVHKTGDETVAGQKIFTSNFKLLKKTACGQFEDTDTSACYAGIQIRSPYLVTGGTVNRASEYVGIRDNPSNPRTRSKITARAPNGSSDAVMQLVAYDTGTAYAEAPSYTADNNADTKIVTRAMLVTTPTIVHTTGTETVAGDKTFTGYTSFRGSTPSVKLITSTQGAGSGIYADLTVRDQYGGSDSDLSVFSWGKSSGGYSFNRQSLKSPDKSTDFVFEQRAYADHHLFVATPYYPVDSGGNPQALSATNFMLSGNIAVDPRIVHTTGNESVAGVKTFQNGIDAYPQNWHDVFKSGMAVGEYCIFAVIPASAGVSGKFIELDFIQSSNGGTVCGRMMFKASLTTPDGFWVYRKTKGGNANMNSDTIHIVADSNNLYLVSKKVSVYGASKCRVNMVMSYGTVQSTGTSITFKTQDEMSVLSNLDGYTEFTVDEP